MRVERWGRKDIGPWHEDQPNGHGSLAWCGARRQYRHWTASQGQAVTCKKCLKAIAENQPRAAGS